MADHTKVCWNCGSKNMLPVDTYFQCQDCQATHVETARLGPDPRAGKSTDAQYMKSLSK